MNNRKNLFLAHAITDVTDTNSASSYDNCHGLSIWRFFLVV